MLFAMSGTERALKAKHGGSAVRPVLVAYFLFCLAVMPSPAQGAPDVPELAAGERAEVRAVRDGETVVLADGRELRLVGIEAPRPAGAQGQDAKAVLEEMVVGRVVELRYAGNRRDRHDRVLAHLFAGDLWVQGEMLQRGLARVQSFADNRAGVREMLRRERRARRARRGIWRDPFYAIRRPDEAGRFANSFQIVEGEVAEAAHIRGEVFLNFAPDWRSAFSLHLGPEALRLFRAEGMDPLELAGKKLRVRGWIHGGRRPIIDVTHPEQIEALHASRS